MCDFHSIIVSTDGRVFHLAKNSHSAIADHYGLKNEPERRTFYECEWNGRGSMPADLVRDRPYGADRDVPERVARTAERHYSRMVAYLAGEFDSNGVIPAPFDQPEYSDVRARYTELAIEREKLAAEREALAHADGLADTIAALDLPQSALAALFRELMDRESVEINDVFEEELEEKCEEAEERGRADGEESGYQSGWESASEELYSSDYVAENWKDFAPEDELAELREEAAEEAHAKGYAEGVAAVLSGIHTASAPALDGFTDSGLARFLLQPRD